MDFWSEGLGDRNLVINLDKSEVGTEGDAVILTGVVDAPADWAYKVTMETDDWTTVLRTATSPEARDFLSSGVGFGKILGMGWWMTQFILLLAVYRFVRLFRIFGKNESKESREMNSPGASCSVSETSRST
jgi:hypothetical protein